MKSFQKITQKQLSNRKLELVSQVYMVYFSSMIVLIFVGTIFSSWAFYDAFLVFLKSSALSAVCIGATYLVRNKVEGTSRKYNLYASIAAGFYIAVSILVWDRYLITTSLGMFTFIYILLFTFKKSIVIMLSGIAIVLAISFMILFPEPSVVLGRSYYLLIVVTMLIVMYISKKGIDLFNWYEKMLLEKITEISTQNDELEALNEEYYAAQDELFLKYDEVQELNGKMYKLAYKDTSTGLLNRNGFTLEIDELIRGDVRFYTVLFEVDDYSFLNSIYGQGTTQKIIEVIKTRLTETKKYEFILGRIEKNQFGIAVKNEAMSLDMVRANRNIIIKHVKEVLNFDIELSVGIAERYKDNLSDGLMKNAETALYIARQRIEGSDVVIYNERYQQAIDRRLYIQRGIQEGITSEQIYLNYQPKYSLIEKKVIGYEALARWQDAKYGFIPPDEFILIAEETGMIIELGDYIRRKTCRFIHELVLYQPEALVSINVSGKELLQEGFSNQFIQTLQDEKVETKNVAIEVTETAAIENLDLAIKNLTEFREKGIKIYLDDFGTGYSSLNYINRLPIDILKIDKSLISDILVDEAYIKTIKTIVELAKNVGMDIIAEGVETKEELLVLKEVGCHMIQGYYISKPLSEDAVLQELKQT